MCFDLYIILSQIFLILRRNKTDMVKNVHWSSCKVPVILVIFAWKVNFLHRVSKYIGVVKICLVGTERTEVRTDPVAFRTHVISNWWQSNIQRDLMVTEWSSTYKKWRKLLCKALFLKMVSKPQHDANISNSKIMLQIFLTRDNLWNISVIRVLSSQAKRK